MKLLNKTKGIIVLVEVLTVVLEVLGIYLGCDVGVCGRKDLLIHLRKTSVEDIHGVALEVAVAKG